MWMMTVLTILLCVYLGGASCQIEGREDPSCLGENQGGTGQKGRTTSVLLCPHSHSRTSLFTPTHNNRCLVIFAARCISLWTSFTARQWSAEKIGHCSVWLCVSAGEGARNQKEASEKRALQDNADTFYTKHLIYTMQPKEHWFLANNWVPCSIESHVVSPLGSRHWTLFFFFFSVFASEWTASVNERTTLVAFYLQWIVETQ